MKNMSWMIILPILITNNCCVNTILPFVLFILISNNGKVLTFDSQKFSVSFLYFTYFIG